MRAAGWFLVVSFCAATLAMAGPNAGGVLVVHDCACVESCDPPPGPCNAPASCEVVDNIIPPSSGAPITQVWRVYAAFPTGSSPRLRSLNWGIDLVGDFDYVYVTAAGLPDPPNQSQVVEGTWPDPTPGASVSESFVITQTGTITECYWFAGYGYDGGEFATVPHASQSSVFTDDSGETDPIEGFSTIGFGSPGTTICPPPMGACCGYDGCTVSSEAGCAAVGGVWQGPGTDCSPSPCSPPLGSCCFEDGHCEINHSFECPGTWTMFGSCIPDPCEELAGACCYPPYDLCDVLTHAQCDSLSGTYLGDFTVCVPAPCPIRGACCFPTGECSLLYPWLCQEQGGIYQGDAHPCEPGLCPPTPAERASWGKIKHTFR